MFKNKITDNPETTVKEEAREKPEEKSFEDFLNELLLEQLEQS